MGGRRSGRNVRRWLGICNGGEVCCRYGSLSGLKRILVFIHAFKNFDVSLVWNRIASGREYLAVIALRTLMHFFTCPGRIQLETSRVNNEKMYK